MGKEGVVFFINQNLLHFALVITFHILHCKRNVWDKVNGCLVVLNNCNFDTSRVYKRFLNIHLPFLWVNIAWTTCSDNKFKCPILFRYHEVLDFLSQGVVINHWSQFFKQILSITFENTFLLHFSTSQMLLLVSFIWIYFF